MTFKFYAPRAKEVQLLGDFNKWDSKSHDMKKNNYGIWQRTSYLIPGHYEYKFLADGNWYCDPRNSKRCTNCFGSENSIIEIDARN